MTEATRRVWDLASLGVDDQQLAQVPTGGIDFGAGDFIAPWLVTVVYTFGTKEDPEMHNSMASDDKKVTMPPYPIRKSSGGWYWLTYNSQEEAETAQNLLDPSPNKIKPGSVWSLAVDTDKILNHADVAALAKGFGERMTFTTAIKSLAASEKYQAHQRHNYQFFVLPFAVQAAALAMGALVKPIYHARELTDEGAEVDNWTHEQYCEYVGDPKGTAVWQSTMGQRRAELWQALGEPNAKAYTAMGTMTPSGKKEASTNTTSEVLSKCIAFVIGKWGVPIYSRVLLVPDPRPDAKSSGGNRLSIACLSEIFGPDQESFELARDIGAAEIAESGASVVAPDHPTLPENWQDAGHDAWVAELVKHGTDKPAAVVAQAAYGDTADLVSEWWAYMTDEGLWSATE